MTNGGSAQPATNAWRSPGGAEGFRLPRRRNPNAPTLGRASFVRWYERLGSGLALVAVIVLSGLVLAGAILLLAGFLMLTVGGAIG